MKNKRKAKGFTLIELLIVITIIGILSTILLPNLGTAQDKAKEASVKAVMHTLQLAVESYSIDEGTYPAGSDLTVTELYDTLSEGGYLKTMPRNPFTSSAYTVGDTVGQVLYSYDESSQRYTLEGFGKTNDKPVLTLTNS